MANIYGREMTRSEVMKRVGDISQIAGAKQYILQSGKAKGVAAIEVKTGSGFSFTVLPDRGLDVAWADYRGIAVGFISKTGVVSPAFYDNRESEFLRSFYGGLVTTCGLTYMGAACSDQGENLGLHGRINNTPAEDISVYNEWENDEFIIKIRGKMRESRVFGENIVLTREITTKLGSNHFTINDSIVNEGFTTQPLMLLYHCNFGYPIVSEDSYMNIPQCKTTPRDNTAAEGIYDCKTFDVPTHNYSEQVFYHDFISSQGDEIRAELFNPTQGNNGIGAYIKFNKRQLPYFIEWKQMGEGDYVVGLEPSTWYTQGRAEARKRGELQYINPGQKNIYNIEIGVFEGMIKN